MDELPCRKQNRLNNYDYSTMGDYFITICSKERTNKFWISDYDCVSVKSFRELLNEAGVIACNVLQNVNSVYKEEAIIEKYVIMPDHIHFIVHIANDNIVSVETVVKNIKRYISIKSGIKDLWQKSFYDHIIRNEKDYAEVWDYIDANPRKLTGNIFME